MAEPTSNDTLIRLELDELRLQLAEAQAHITALELASYRQQQQLDLLQDQLRRVWGQLQAVAPADGAAPAANPRDDIPPHY